MGKRNLKYIGPIGGSSPSVLKDAPITVLDKKIRFSLRDCDTGTYCIRNLATNEITRIYKRLGYFEDLTWQQIQQKGHEDGFSIEKKDSENHVFFSRLYSNYDTFLHFRVTGTRSNVFRVFAARKEDMCVLLWIDKDGIQNH